MLLRYDEAKGRADWIVQEMFAVIRAQRSTVVTETYISERVEGEFVKNRSSWELVFECLPSAIRQLSMMILCTNWLCL
jgi:hypothetical protein